MLKMLSGKKTYAVVWGSVGLAVLMLLGVEIPLEVWLIDGALFGGAMRSALKKLEPPKVRVTDPTHPQFGKKVSPNDIP